MKAMKIDPTAEVGPHSVISTGAIIGPGAVIGDWAKIGPNVVIGARARIGAFARVDEHVVIGERAVLSVGVHVGANSDIRADAEVNRSIPPNSIAERLHRPVLKVRPDAPKWALGFDGMFATDEQLKASERSIDGAILIDPCGQIISPIDRSCFPDHVLVNVVWPTVVWR